MSGSGKSVVVRLLEDAGFFCIDNLPSRFLGEVGAYLKEHGHRSVAVSIDARTESSLARLPEIIEQLRGIYDVRVLFLTASTAALVQRYSESRRPHPLSESGEAAGGARRTLTESIDAERDRLTPLMRSGHLIDTTALQPARLRDWVRQLVDSPRAALTLTFESFAYKDGIPVDADFVFDVRNLPNPFYEPDLRELTGRDAPVAGFLRAQPAVGELIGDIAALLAKWLPAHSQNARHYVTVAIGCTGGRHRSVYMAEQLAKRFEQGFQDGFEDQTGRVGVLVRHRTLGG
jgi:UPF0042 nucleotide-binding protein